MVAQIDVVPPYREENERQVHRLSTVDGDPIFEGLPCGSIFSFAWNFLISFSFQFVGFLLTYLLHTTHAAKYGSRAGMGVTLIQYGLYSHAPSNDFNSAPFDDSSEDPNSNDKVEQFTRLIRRGSDLLYGRTYMPLNFTTPDMMDNSTAMGNSSSQWDSNFVSPSSDWFSFLLMTIGTTFN